MTVNNKDTRRLYKYYEYILSPSLYVIKTIYKGKEY